MGSALTKQSPLKSLPSVHQSPLAGSTVRLKEMPQDSASVGAASAAAPMMLLQLNSMFVHCMMFELMKRVSHSPFKYLFKVTLKHITSQRVNQQDCTKSDAVIYYVVV